MPIIQRKLQAKNIGFTLIEVMVAALVLAIGILGLVTAMLTGLKSDKSAYFRSQASAIAYDMADRMRLNQENIANYVNVNTSNAAPNDPGCIKSASGCTPGQQLSQDIREWKANFDNVFNLTKFTPKLPNGQGVVTQDGAGRYIVTVSWSEDDWDEADLSQRKDVTENLSITLTF